MELTWDFYRELAPNGATLGGCVHYFDESAQSLFLSGGALKTKTCLPEFGHWKNTSLSQEISVDSPGYVSSAFDHPHNGTLYGAVSDGSKVYFLRHVYAKDISDLFISGSTQDQIDNQIKSLTMTLVNASADVFTANNTLFNPGAKITLDFVAGDSPPYRMIVAYLDDLDYDVYSDSVPISSRNSIGYFLSSQSFDDECIYTGGLSTVLLSILTNANIEFAHIQQNDEPIDIEFDPQKTILEGINELCSSVNWRMIELPDGYICVGSEEYLSTYNANGRYTFNGGTEVFTRATSKNADAAYSRVAVINSYGYVVYRDVLCWNYWNIGRRKTKYYQSPEGADEIEIDALADKYALALQYVGIGEEFSGPIRPYIQIGDVAEIFYQGDSQATSLGIITQVSHTFGNSGFSTSFSLDSGGVATDEINYTVTKAAVLNGYNRKQRIVDLMAFVAEKKAVGVYSGGARPVGQNSISEGASISQASIMKMM